MRFPWETAPRFLLRNRDGVNGADFRRRVASMGIEGMLTAARSPLQAAKSSTSPMLVIRRIAEAEAVLEEGVLLVVADVDWKLFNRARPGVR